MQLSFNRNTKLGTKLLVTVLACSLVTVATDDYSAHSTLREGPYSAKVLYSRNSHPDREIIKLIQRSSRYVYFAVYTLTKDDLADALIAAKIRGLDVRGVLDFSQSTIPQEKPLLAKLKKYEIPLKIPLKPAGLMHIKMLVTDAGYASGSYNWTYSATLRNDEVLEIGTSPIIRDQYLKIFNTL